MVTATPRKGLTYEEYVASERTSEVKHEYVAGELFAMSGAKRAHNHISANIIASLVAQLRDRPCVVYTSDMRVRTRDDVGAYPDVTALCGPAELDAGEDELLNPALIVEVLSDSTERYDRGEKFEHYQTIPSFREYVLASSSRARIEVFTRQDDGSWLLRSYAPGEVAKLSSLRVEVAVDEAYRKVFDVVEG